MEPTAYCPIPLLGLNLSDIQVMDPTAFSISLKSSSILFVGVPPAGVLWQKSFSISADSLLSFADLCINAPLIQTVLAAMSSGTMSDSYLWTANNSICLRQAVEYPV